MNDTAELLRAIASWAEASDLVVARFAAVEGRPHNTALPTVTAVLLGIVSWLEEHPDVDQQITNLLCVA